MELIVVISKILHFKFLIFVIILFFLIFLRLWLWNFTIVSHDSGRLQFNMLFLFSIFDNHALTFILTTLSRDHHDLHLLLPRTVLILYHLSNMILLRGVRSAAPLCDPAIRCARMQFHLSVLIWKELLLMLIAILLLVILAEGLCVGGLWDSTILLPIGVADQMVGCQVSRLERRVSLGRHHLGVELPTVLVLLVASIILGAVRSHVHFQILN